MLARLQRKGVDHGGILPRRSTTFLERMAEKGWLKYREEGRAYLYSAAVPRQTSIGERVFDVVASESNGNEMIDAPVPQNTTETNGTKRLHNIAENSSEYRAG